jgi:hypothetical protein
MSLTPESETTFSDVDVAKAKADQERLRADRYATKWKGSVIETSTFMVDFLNGDKVFRYSVKCDTFQKVTIEAIKFGQHTGAANEDGWVQIWLVGEHAKDAKTLEEEDLYLLAEFKV